MDKITKQIVKNETFTKQEAEMLVKKEIEEVLKKINNMGSTYALSYHNHDDKYQERDNYVKFIDLSNYVLKKDITNEIKEKVDKRLKLSFIDNSIGVLLFTVGTGLITRALWYIHPGVAFAFLGIALVTIAGVTTHK